MKKSEFLKYLRSKLVCYSWSNYSADDGTYVQIVKSNLIQILNESEADIEYNVTVMDNAIYIN